MQMFDNADKPRTESSLCEYARARETVNDYYLIESHENESLI